jgi:hypothetical protein
MSDSDKYSESDLIHALENDRPISSEDLQSISRYSYTDNLCARVNNIVRFESPNPANFEWIPEPWIFIRESIPIEEGIKHTKIIQRRLKNYYMYKTGIYKTELACMANVYHIKKDVDKPDYKTGCTLNVKSISKTTTTSTLNSNQKHFI